MTILNEAGTPDVSPPLAAVGSLASRSPGALVVVLGSRSEAFIVQSTSAPSPAGYAPLPKSPRVVMMVIDPFRPPEEGYVASRIIESAAGFRGLEAVFVVAGRTARSLGVDAAAEAQLTGRRLGLPVVVVDPDALYEAPGVLATDLEDGLLAAMVGISPEEVPPEDLEPEDPEGQEKTAGLFGGLGGLLGRPRERERSSQTAPVVLIGGLNSALSGEEVSSSLSRAGVRVSGTIPAVSGGLSTLPAVGEGTVVGLLEPNLSGAAKAATERGASVVRTLFPVGVDGMGRFLQDVAAEAGGSTTEVARARSVWQGLQGLRNQVRGKRIFFAGDTGLEIPLARFLADAGAVVLEVGAPRLDRKMLSEELQALGPDVDVVESPGWQGQMRRIEKANPDAVIASPGLYGPLVARGQLCRSSRDLARLGVHGYEGARRVLQMLADTFERADSLDASVNV